MPEPKELFQYILRETECEKDLEGLQTMRILGNNMSFVLKLIENGKKNNIDMPLLEEKIKTNFIR